MRYLVPLILVVASIGLFIMYTDPAFVTAKEMSSQLSQYNDALSQSTQVRQVRDQLLSRRNTLSTGDVKRLERLLPDNVDNIHLIIDINDIAARYHLQMTNVSVSSAQESGTGGVGAGTSPIGSMTLAFNVNATYDEFVSFMQDVERSLRIVDVKSIKFDTSSQTTGTNDMRFSVQLQTYWLR